MTSKKPETITVEVPNIKFVEGPTLTVPVPNIEFATPPINAKEPCPFVYATGKKCQGHIVRIEAYKADISWEVDDKTGIWKFSLGGPRSHYHLFCSLKSNHAGWDRPDSEQLKFYFDQLPASLQAVIKEV
jgi:hypothetical protein